MSHEAIRRPVVATINTTLRCVTLGDHNGKAQNVVVKGAIAFPKPLPDQPDTIAGEVLLGTFDIDTNVVTIQEEMTFYTIETVINDVGQIESHGLSEMLALAWSTYKCRDFYVACPSEIQRRYTMAIREDPNVQPKPHMIPVTWDAPTAEALILELLQRRRLRLSDKSTLVAHLASSIPPQPAKQPVDVQAVATLLVGMNRHPYRRPREIPDVRPTTYITSAGGAYASAIG